MQPYSNIHSTNHSNNNFVTVDIRLCGDIPRNEMKERLVGAPGLARRSLHSRPTALNASCLAATNGLPTHHKTTICDALSGLIVQKKSSSEMNLQVQRANNNTINDDQVLQPILSVDFFVPNWAVPTRGESKLEPVCESLGLQESVDLTKRKAFLAGRSPGCDVQLVHATSSRRHAMLFHHANGSCYVVDCGSAHGTFVNGKRIHSPTARGVVIPHRVRRGSMIRFGGPGAPCFVLKCFSTTLATVSCNDEDSSQLVKRNTRLNAIGRTHQEPPSHQSEEDCFFDPVRVERKRSFDSLSSTGSLDMEIPDCKRMRCSSPPLSPEQPLRLVSPDPPPAKCCRRVTFSLDPPQFFHAATITPDISRDDEEHNNNINNTESS